MNKVIKGIVILAMLFMTTSMGFADSIMTDAKLQYNKGLDYYNLGQYENAITHFRQAVELDPNYIDAYYNLGSLLEYLHQDEAALGVFKQIMLRKPDDYDAIIRTIALSKKLGENDKIGMYMSLLPKDSYSAIKAKEILKTTPTVVKKEEVKDIVDQVVEQELPQKIQQEVVTQVQKPETVTTEVIEKIKDVEQKVVEQIKENPVEDVPSYLANKVEPVTNYVEPDKAVETKTFLTSNPKADGYGTYDDILSPTGVVADRHGDVYVAGFSDNTIYKITPDNKKLVYIKSEKIDGPIDIAKDNNDNLYIANYNKNNILKVDANGAITVLIENIVNPYCLDVTDGLLFITSQGDNMILRYKL